MKRNLHLRCIVGMATSAVLFLVFTDSAQADLLDNFESYATGNVASEADPPWTVTAGTEVPTIGMDMDGNKYQESAGSFVGLGANSIAEGSTSTVFFRFFSIAGNNPDLSFGVSDLATPTGNWGNFEAYLILSSATNLQARDGGGGTTIATVATDTWYNAWLVIDNAADTYDVYLSTGTADATAGDLEADDFAFRNGTTDSIASFKIYGRESSGTPRAGRFDDININSGVDLTNYAAVPEPNAMLLLGLGSMATIFRRRTPG